MGDVVSLVEKAQLQLSEEEAMATVKKMQDSRFDFNDFLKQVRVQGGLGWLGRVGLGVDDDDGGGGDCGSVVLVVMLVVLLLLVVVMFLVPINLGPVLSQSCCFDETALHYLGKLVLS
jgi:hypothetical protein